VIVPLGYHCWICCQIILKIGHYLAKLWAKVVSRYLNDRSMRCTGRTLLWPENKFFGRHFPKCWPIWIKFGRDLLLHGIYLWIQVTSCECRRLRSGPNVRLCLYTILTTELQRCRWQTRKWLGSRICCRETFRNFITWAESDGEIYSVLRTA